LVCFLNYKPYCKKIQTKMHPNSLTQLMSLMATFSEVARTASFTQAASRMGLSNSVVSRHVTALEKELGTQLIYRSTHGLTLTEAGEEFFIHCEELQTAARRAAEFGEAARQTPHGRLRITLPQTLVVSPVGALISKFQQRFPDLRLDVRVTSLQRDPIEEGFDVALRIGRLKDSNLVGRKIRDVHFIAVASASYLARRGAPRAAEDLRGHNCLVYSEFASHTRWTFKDDTVARKTTPLTGNFATNSGVLLINALLAGQGIVVGPDLMFESLLKRRRVRVVLDGQLAQPTGLYAVFPKTHFPSTNRKAFVDFLLESL
jgi:DNA-binding transcriptional LysR family regulator